MLIWRKTDEIIWTPPLPPFLREPPISEQFFHDPPLCPNFKNKIPPNFRGEEMMQYNSFLINVGFRHYLLYYFPMIYRNRTNALRSWSRSKIIFEKFFIKIKKKACFMYVWPLGQHYLRLAIQYWFNMFHLAWSEVSRRVSFFKQKNSQEIIVKKKL